MAVHFNNLQEISDLVPDHGGCLLQPPGPGPVQQAAQGLQLGPHLGHACLLVLLPPLGNQLQAGGQDQDGGCLSQDVTADLALEGLLLTEVTVKR